MRKGRRGAAPALLCAVISWASSLERTEAAPACAPAVSDARVGSVPDIRTVILEDGRRLRPAGIESFRLLSESAEAIDAALNRRMEALLAGLPVSYGPASEEVDRYGRIEALIVLPNGSLLQEVLVREGLAIAMPGETAALPCFAAILRAEAEARALGRGGWSGRLAQLPRASPDELAGHLNGFAIFEGTVLSVGARTNSTYLNFGRTWSEDVTATVRGRARERFGGEPGLQALQGRRVRLRGFIEDWSGPSVTLHSPDQIEVLGTARNQMERP